MTLERISSSRRLLTRIVESPELVTAVRGLPTSAFSALVRHVGVEDAGELLALASTPQLVAAFDEDLFSNPTPGERETFDPKRFATWLEVLLEAGSEAAAKRFSELSEDFVAHALSSLVLVLDADALSLQMSESDEDDTRAVEKALESSLVEDIDGYMLVARTHDGWDAVLALVLALDRDHRALLERVLDRCAAVSQRYVDDLDELYEVLTEGESLTDDVEAEREERRSKAGYVEPRAAKSFLALAAKPLGRDEGRDPVTRAYFRELGAPEPAAKHDEGAQKLMGLLAQAEGAPPPAMQALTSGSVRSEERGVEEGRDGRRAPVVEAIRALSHDAPEVYAQRLEELAFLTNVLVAGAKTEGERFSPSAAAEAAIATIGLGAELFAVESRSAAQRRAARCATADELVPVVRSRSADVLFRRASSALVASGLSTRVRGVVSDEAEAETARAGLATKTT